MSRILAIDHGNVRTGIAISDELRITSRALDTVHATSTQEIIDRIIPILEQYRIALILVGMPYDPNGQKGLQARKIEIFCQELKKNTAIPVEYVDETYTSKDAENLVAQESKKGKSEIDKDLIDAKAAQIILSTYLNK